MSAHLQTELEKLKERLLYLGSLAENSVKRAGLSFKNMDAQLAREVIEFDNQIDLKEVEIEEECLKILALYTPVANDLRIVIATLKINNDLERVSDLGVNIAERVVYLTRQTAVPVPFDFEKMWTISVRMLKNALDAFVHGNVALARQVCEEDDEVDAINKTTYHQVYEGIKKNPADVEAYIHYLSISRHLERVADYATNISEEVIYMIEGTIIRHQPEEFSGLRVDRDLPKV